MNWRILIPAFAVLALATSAIADTDLQFELRSAAPNVPQVTIENEIPLAWEKGGHTERRFWSDYAFDVINQYFDELDQADDTPRFCKNYKSLTRDQKIMVWGQIFVGISYWETGWDPLNRTVEGPDLDEITHEKPVSEGLLQLSYSDMVNYTDLQTDEPYCPFTWDKDKELPETDIHRSILNPYVNLYCGIRIMADSVVKNADPKGEHKVIYNGYWSTLGTSGIHNRARNIRKLVNHLPFCGGSSWAENPLDLLLNTINHVQKAIKRAREHAHEHAHPSPAEGSADDGHVAQ